MNVRRLFADPFLFWVCLAASLLGLVAIWDAGYARVGAGGSVLPRELRFQAVYLVIAVLVGWGCSRIPRASWRWLGWVGLAVSFGLLVAVRQPEIGHSLGGAQRWIKLGPLTVQPSEFIKLAVIMFLAATMAAHEPWKVRRRAIRNIGERIDRVWLPKLKRALPFLLVLALAVMVERQPDLATAAVIVAGAVGIIIVAGVTRKSLVLLAAASVVLVSAAVVEQPYRLERLTTHAARWEPENVRGKGYQTVISETALARGGVFGVGLGDGTAKHRLPAPTTDFVLTTVGEEFGLVGALSVVMLLAVVSWRLLWLAARAPDRFGRLALVGFGVWIGIQACTNVLMVNGTVPPIGVPLPFISYGGSSLLALWMAVGLSMTMGGQQSKKEVKKPETRRYGWRNRRARVSRA